MDQTGWSDTRIPARARNSLVLVAGMLSPRASATSRKDRPEIVNSVYASRKFSGSFATAAENAEEISRHQADFSGDGAREGNNSGPCSSTGTQVILLLGSRNSSRQQFTTMRLIQVLKDDSPRKCSIWRIARK